MLTGGFEVLRLKQRRTLAFPEARAEATGLSARELGCRLEEALPCWEVDGAPSERWWNLLLLAALCKGAVGGGRCRKRAHYSDPSPPSS